LAVWEVLEVLEVSAVSANDFALATPLFRQLESRTEWARADSTAGTGAQASLGGERDGEIQAANFMAM
jgi:hypothetical protein